MKISKKSKSVLYILGALLLLVYGGNYMQNGTFSIGGAVMSLGLVDYLPYDNDVSGKTWLLTTSINGNGNYYVAKTFSPTEIKDVADGVKSQYDLTLKVETTPMICRYSIDNRNKAEPIYSLSSTYMGYSLTEIVTHTYENQCSGYADAYRFWRNGAENYCFRKTQIGTHGVLNTPATVWSAKITATPSVGLPESKSLSSWGQQSVWLGNNVYVSWVGDLVGPEECPKNNIPDAVFKDGSWKTTDSQAYSDYRRYYDTSGDFDTCITTYKNADTCTNNFNIKATNAVVSKPLSMYAATDGNTYSVSTGGTSIDSGQVDLNVDKQLRNPVLTFKIKADWIKVVQEWGMPDITSANNVEFTTGSSGIVNVQIKNIGSGFGTFDYYASCTSGLSQSGKVPDKLQMAAGQTLTGQLYITGTASQDTTGSCTINAYDVNNPTNKDSATITAKIKTICEATEPVGTKKCSGSTIVQSDGCRYQIVQSCTNGCEYQNGQPQCKAETGGGTCTPNWQTSAWSSCVNGIQTRNAYDANNCNVATGKPLLAQSCGGNGGDTGSGALPYVLALAAGGLLLYGAFGNKMKW